MLKMDKAILIIVDVQGKLARQMYETDKLIHNLRIMIRGARVLEIPVVWLEQYPEGMGETIPEIAELMKGIRPISKTSFSGCGSEEFMNTMGGLNRDQVLVAGIETHICVYQTASDLMRSGYAVQVVSDGVSSRTRENKRIGLMKMKEAGVSVTSTETALFELMKRAGTPQFKEILQLVR